MALDTTHGNAKKTDKQNSSKQIVEREELKGTPFTIIKWDELWYLCVGKYRFTEGMKTKTMVIKASKDASWFRIMTFINMMIKDHEERMHQTKTKPDKNQTKLEI